MPLIRSKYFHSNLFSDQEFRDAIVSGNEEVFNQKDYTLDQINHIRLRFRSTNRFTTPLCHLLRNGALELARRFIDEGADVCLIDDLGNTPWSDAFLCNDKELTRAILNSPTFGVTSRTSTKSTPLHKLCHTGETEFVNYLLDKGANPFSQDDLGRTPLHEAVENNSVETVQLLTKNPRLLEIKDNDGDTPLHDAVKLGKANLVDTLIRAGANVGALDYKGNTLLHSALKNGISLPLIQPLVEAGVPFEGRNDQGETVSYLLDFMNITDKAAYNLLHNYIYKIKDSSAQQQNSVLNQDSKQKLTEQMDRMETAIHEMSKNLEQLNLYTHSTLEKINNRLDAIETNQQKLANDLSKKAAEDEKKEGKVKSLFSHTSSFRKGS